MQSKCIVGSTLRVALFFILKKYRMFSGLSEYQAQAVI